jgi:hypothetical protein
MLQTISERLFMEEAGVLMSTEARSLTQPLGNPTLNLLKAPQNYGL